MSVMASQITSVSIVYPTVFSNADQRKHQSSAVTGEFPTERASNAENISIDDVIMYKPLFIPKMTKITETNIKCK